MLQMNGLLLSNVWAGYHLLLNPDYKAAVQWRFVNRAIDEVENDGVRPMPPQAPSAGCTGMMCSQVDLCSASGGQAVNGLE